jgi:hypothetical protein
MPRKLSKPQADILLAMADGHVLESSTNLASNAGARLRQNPDTADGWRDGWKRVRRNTVYALCARGLISSPWGFPTEHYHLTDAGRKLAEELKGQEGRG